MVAKAGRVIVLVTSCAVSLTLANLWLIRRAGRAVRSTPFVIGSDARLREKR
jgi:hypothetical protein